MDDNILELITKHLRGESTSLEQRKLMLWLESSPENRRFYADFSANWSLHTSLTSPGLEQDTERMLSRLNARIDAVSSTSGKHIGRKIWIGLSSAAVFVGIMVGLMLLLRTPLQDNRQMDRIANQTDDTSMMVLEDGTHVYLRPGAKLAYNVLTLKGRREAELTGDAYFDVSRDEEKPFFVKTGNIQVQVLGTAFSVSASPDASQVVLERGSVRLLSASGEPLVSLQPNQKALWRTGGGGVRVEPVYATAFVTDKYNLVAFNDATVPEILKALQDMFHVRLTCDRTPENKRYNLAFLKSDSLENVVSIIEYMTGAKCHIDYIN